MTKNESVFYTASGITLTVATITFLIIAISFSNIGMYQRALLIFAAVSAVRGAIAAFQLAK